MNTESDTATPFSAERWGACGILLSMDCMQPFVNPMGLQLDAERLKPVIRQAILASREAFERATTIPAFSSRAVEAIDARLGAGERDKFLFWFTHVFTFSVHDHYPWQLWISALMPFSGNPSLWAQLMLPSRCSSTLYQTLRAVIENVDIWALWSQAGRHPLSDWDLEMYSIHKFDDESKDPFTWVVLTYEMKCFKLFWRELRAALTEKELIQLWSALRDDPILPPNSHMRGLPDPLLMANEV